MRLARLVPVTVLALVACGRRQGSPGEGTAPSASVVTIGMAIGGCEQIDVCERECDAGSADRCRRLGVTYAFGQGVEADQARATALYGRACDLGDAPACVFAGQMHEYAHGVPKDDVKAVALYERACDRGWPAGCYNLAIMFEHGRGVAQDRAKAADLYQVACTAGAKQACTRAMELHEPPVAP